MRVLALIFLGFVALVTPYVAEACRSALTTSEQIELSHDLGEVDSVVYVRVAAIHDTPLEDDRFVKRTVIAEPIESLIGDGPEELKFTGELSAPVSDDLIIVGCDGPSPLSAPIGSEFVVYLTTLSSGESHVLRTLPPSLAAKIDRRLSEMNWTPAGTSDSIGSH